MRDILFRGKRIDNGEWVQGSFRIDPDLGRYCIYYCEYYSGDCGLERDENEVKVIHKTVGQYTGLTDKNGTKIFEGDICKYGDYIGYIEYDDSEAMFTFTYDENICTNFDCLYGTELEVIGNIHDNPELLGGE